MVENSVVWIPYGWVTIMVNCTGQVGFPRTLVIPYLNAKLAAAYPSLGQLVNFHFTNVEANKDTGGKFWKEHGDSYLEWLGILNCQDDQEGTRIVNPGQPALCLTEGLVEDGDIPPDMNYVAVKHNVEGGNLAENETQL